VEVRPYDKNTGQPTDTTLTLYLQHRERYTPLNTALSHEADLVYFCFPETTDVKNYALEGAIGTVFFQYDEAARVLFLFDTPAAN
jgi:hypothetical protein